MANFIGTPSVSTVGTFSLGGNDLIREVARDVTTYDRESSPLTSFLSQTKGRLKPTSQTTFEWQEQQYDYGTNVVTASIVGGNPTENVIVSSPTVVVGDAFFEATSGQYFVTHAVVSRTSTTSTVTLMLFPTGSNIAAVTGPYTLVSCGNILVEGGYYPDARGTRPTFKSNSITSTSYSVDITEEMMYSPTYYGNKFQMDKEAAITQFRCDMERNVLFGQYFVATGYTQASVNGSFTGTLRGTRGVINTVDPGNVQTFSGSLTESKFDTFLRTAVWNNKYSGSSTKIGLFGPDAALDLNQFVKDKVRVLQMGRQAYGIDIAQYTLFGNFKILVMLEKEFWEVAPYKHGILVVDPKFIWLRQFGPNFMEVKDTSLPRQAGHSIALSSRYGVEARFATSHAILKNPN